MTADLTFLKLEEKCGPITAPGEFYFSVIGLSHPHVYAMCEGLIEAGATLKFVYEEDLQALTAFQKRFAQAISVSEIDEVLSDAQTRLVVGDSLPQERCAIGLRVMDAGKDYFCDKVPMLSLQELESARKKVRETGRKYMVYYGERIHVEGAVYAEQLIKQGAIGRVVQMVGLGPHRLNEKARPKWFFDKARCGGILCDLGSHQIEQFLFYCGVKKAQITQSHTANYAHPSYPNWEDFGDASLLGENGASGYFRVDWFTPDGLDAWGDSRTFLLGTEGTIEIRKYSNVAQEREGNHVFLVDRHKERHFFVTGKVGFPFFSRLIFDCIHRTETAMTQEHAFYAAQLCLQAQQRADSRFLNA